MGSFESKLLIDCHMILFALITMDYKYVSCNGHVADSLGQFWTIKGSFGE